MAAYFPLFVNMEQRKFYIFGAGQVAARRISGLLRHGADITVIAPQIHKEIQLLQAQYPGQVHIEQRTYRLGEIQSGCVDYVLAATDDAKANADIYRECCHKEIPVNNASDSSQCDFYFPALVEMDNLVVGITSTDGDHEKTARFSQSLRQMAADGSLGIQKKPVAREIRIGTRDSLLAVTQAGLLKQYLEGHCPGVQVSLVKMKTAGDKALDRSLDKIGGKGLFVKELDQALREGYTDLSVHSLKDMPVEEDASYPVLGYSKREVPQDALVLPEGAAKIDFTKPIGTSSPRRQIQLKQLYPQCRTAPVRGNIQTRLRKLDAGEYGALVLAAAGLVRLGYQQRISYLFPISEMIPAAGQGILAVQGRKGFDTGFLEGFFDEDAKWQALAERSFVRTFDGGCFAPVAAYAQITGGRMALHGFWQSPGGQAVKGILEAPKQEAESLGQRLAKSLAGQASFVKQF